MMSRKEGRLGAHTQSKESERVKDEGTVAVKGKNQWPNPRVSIVSKNMESKENEETNGLSFKG